MLSEFVIKKGDVARRGRRPGSERGCGQGDRPRLADQAPVAGATVAAMIHVLPIWVPDEDKEVEPGADEHCTRCAGSTPNWASPRPIWTCCA